MTLSEFDPIAVWHFSSKNTNNYFELSSREFGVYPIWMFWNLRRVLNLLYESKLLRVSKITFLGDSKAVVNYHSVDRKPDEIVGDIVDKVNDSGFSSSIKFSGRTTLLERGEEKSFNNIVGFHCSLDSAALSISVYSDCWVPIDRNDQLQLDLAQNSSQVLTEALLGVKNLGFEIIDPDEAEEYTDELLPQYGFKVYLWDSTTNGMAYNALSAEEKVLVEKYLWKNRMNHPA